MADANYHSPARSGGEPVSLTESENESESWDLVTEVPGSPDQTIIDGWLKFRDAKKYNSLAVITRSLARSLFTAGPLRLRTVLGWLVLYSVVHNYNGGAANYSITAWLSSRDLWHTHCLLLLGCHHAISGRLIVYCWSVKNPHVVQNYNNGAGNYSITAWLSSRDLWHAHCLLLVRQESALYWAELQWWCCKLQYNSFNVITRSLARSLSTAGPSRIRTVLGWLYNRLAVISRPLAGSLSTAGPSRIRTILGWLIVYCWSVKNPHCTGLVGTLIVVQNYNDGAGNYSITAWLSSRDLWHTHCLLLVRQESAQ
ncbi:hypothetical protein J6590_003098 [Homalodisca vitripennis]|nr:hypothetical protein J6590_003098 [Homalodisca vitripennis]